MENINLKNLPNHVDPRGSIQAVLESCEVGSISIIESATETERATHYHPADNHWILITKGEIWIYERLLNSKDCPKKTILKSGDLHFTGSGVEHTMYFPIPTIFHCYSKLSRNQASYENNTLRLEESLKAIHDRFPYQNG